MHSAQPCNRDVFRDEHINRIFFIFFLRFRYLCVLVVSTNHIVNSSACLNSWSVPTLGCVLLLLFTLLSVLHVSMCSEPFTMLHACRPVHRLCRHYQECPSASLWWWLTDRGAAKNKDLFSFSTQSIRSSTVLFFSFLPVIDSVLNPVLCGNPTAQHFNQVLNLVPSHAFSLIFYSPIVTRITKIRRQSIS